MTDTLSKGSAPEGVAHSHAEEFDAERYAVGTVTQAGTEHRFTFPADNTDPTIRYELPDGTVGEHPNPNGIVVADSDDGDVVWDPVHRVHVPRVRTSDGGAGTEAAAV